MSSHTTTLGGLVVGEIPRVVGTISSANALSGFAAIRENLCDLVEIRLDEVGESADWEPACARIEEAGFPVIATLRARSEGGKCDMPDTERRVTFKRALGSASAIDVEFRSGLGPKLADDLSSDQAIIASYHDFFQTPPPGDLKKVIREASDFATIVKIATMVETKEDIKTLHSLFLEEWSVPICVIGMGAKGTATRTAFAALGSCLTYGYLDRPSAPGQLSSAFLVDYLRHSMGSYNEDFIHRNKVFESV